MNKDYIIYVAGFLFSEDESKVVLIEKNKPDFLKGLFNPVGGKKENNETSLEAMIREFKEETGVMYMIGKNIVF
jgi:8-oxo-dGTP diphosphatase